MTTRASDLSPASARFPLGLWLALGLGLGGHALGAEHFALQWATYLGASDSPDFPTTPGAYQSVKGAGRDALMVRLRADCTGLLYSTFIGGAADEDGRSGYLTARLKSPQTYS